MLRILIVDDYEASAAMLSLLLEDLGHEVGVAHDGPAALEAFDAAEYDLVLLDIGLPGMDGFEVAQRLRAHERGPDIMLVALTGYPEEFAGSRREHAGFDHYLIKSSDFDALQRLLEQIEGDRT